jgi:hypothetical protein
VAYRLKLPDDSKIHDVFHVSQLKPFVADYTAVFSELPVTTDIEATNAQPEKIMERRLVKRGNTAIPQVRVQWTGLPATSQPGRTTTFFASATHRHLLGDKHHLRQGEMSDL